jgi:hypothetical protein
MTLSYEVLPSLKKKKRLMTLTPGGCPFANTFEVSSWAEIL